MMTVREERVLTYFRCAHLLSSRSSVNRKHVSDIHIFNTPIRSPDTIISFTFVPHSSISHNPASIDLLSVAWTHHHFHVHHTYPAHYITHSHQYTFHQPQSLSLQLPMGMFLCGRHTVPKLTHDGYTNIKKFKFCSDRIPLDHL